MSALPVGTQATPVGRRTRRKTHPLKHALWRYGLVLRGRNYRVSQIRRIVRAALEHLLIPANARATEAEWSGGDLGLTIVIAWDHTLPPLESAALSRYIENKVISITGLQYKQFDVFFEAETLQQTVSDELLASHWLRDRIGHLIAKSHRSTRVQVPSHPRGTATSQPGCSTLNASSLSQYDTHADSGLVETHPSNRRSPASGASMKPRRPATAT